MVNRTQDRGTGRKTWTIHTVLNRQVMPVIMACLGLSVIIRGAMTYTNSEVNLFNVPGLGRPLFAGMGLSIAACVELLMAIAGHEYVTYKRLARETLARRDMRKAQREAQSKEYKGYQRLNFWVMLLGFGASIFSGVYVLATMGGDSTPMKMATDAAVTVISTVAFLYLGALRVEPPEPADTQEAMPAADTAGDTWWDIATIHEYAGGID